MTDDYSPGMMLHSLRSPSTKFNLFLKTRELHAIESVLHKVLTLPSEERRAWVDSNGLWLQDAFDMFVQDSNMTLAEVSLDEETMELSKELVMSLRNTMSMVDGILVESKQALS